MTQRGQPQAEWESTPWCPFGSSLFSYLTKAASSSPLPSPDPTPTRVHPKPWKELLPTCSFWRPIQMVLKVGAGSFMEISSQILSIYVVFFYQNHFTWERACGPGVLWFPVSISPFTQLKTNKGSSGSSIGTHCSTLPWGLKPFAETVDDSNDWLTNPSVNGSWFFFKKKW